MNVLSLCSGVGGLELGIRLAEPSARVVAYVEREAFAQAVLVARMEDAALDRAPILEDLTGFDGRPWDGVVDCISAGFPCQPASAAGQRRGLEDERWIWPHIERIIREVRPSLVFLENVPGLLSVRGGFRAVLGSLAALGFDAEWDVFSAAEVGAPHRRERVFILAYRQGWDARGAWGGSEAPDDSLDLADATSARRNGTARQQGLPVGRTPQAARSGDGGRAVADSNDAGTGRTDTEQVGRPSAEPLDPCATMANAERGRHDRGPSVALGGPERGVASERPSEGVEDSNRKRLAESGTARRRRSGPTDAGGSGEHADEPGLADGLDGAARDSFPAAFPPGPLDEPAWKAWIGAGGPEPVVRRGSDGTSARVDRLRSLGNGVVPQVAAEAWRRLKCRIRKSKV